MRNNRPLPQRARTYSSIFLPRIRRRDRSQKNGTAPNRRKEGKGGGTITQIRAMRGCPLRGGGGSGRSSTLPTRRILKERHCHLKSRSRGEGENRPEFLEGAKNTVIYSQRRTIFTELAPKAAIGEERKGARTCDSHQRKERRRGWKRVQ